MSVSFLTHEEGTLAYEDHGGTGPLVLMTPGIGDLRAAYRFLAPGLVEAGYHVVSMDLRGHGDASVGWREYTPQAVGRDMLAVTQHLAAGRAILIGASMTAASAVWAAATKPELVQALVLVGPSLRDPQMSALQRGMGAVLLGGPWRVSVWATFYGSLYPARKPDDLADHRARLRSNLAQPGRFAALKAFMGATKQECTKRMSQISTPALVVMGDRDPDFKDQAAEARWMADELHGELCMVEESGHYPHADSAEEVLVAMLPFLRNHQHQS